MRHSQAERNLGPFISRRLQAVSAILTMAGIAVAAYLTLVHYRDDLLVCAVGGCETVQNSEYATMAGIPVALLGLGMFVTVAGLSLLREVRPATAETATFIIFCLALTGTLFAAYLTYLELFVIDAICQWCVITALLTTALLVVEGVMAWRLIHQDDALEEGDMPA